MTARKTQQCSHLSKKVEEKRPLIKNKKNVSQYHHCYINVCHELPESANVLVWYVHHYVHKDKLLKVIQNWLFSAVKLEKETVL